MEAYSLDSRKKIVEAKERGMPTSEVAKTFGVGVSSVKRYAAAARGKIPRSEKAPRIEAQARRSGEKAAGSGPAGATGGNTAGEARVPEAGGRRGGQRLHGEQDAQADGVEPKKDWWVRASATSS